jgi:hypothetical protein
MCIALFLQSGHLFSKQVNRLHAKFIVAELSVDIGDLLAEFVVG